MNNLRLQFALGILVYASWIIKCTVHLAKRFHSVLEEQLCIDTKQLYTQGSTHKDLLTVFYYTRHTGSLKEVCALTLEIVEIEWTYLGEGK